MDQLLEQMKVLHESIARRAFEIFHTRGRATGNDLEDWFRAEGDLLHTAHLELAESEDALLLRAEVPGFRSGELQVAVERRRLIIAGKREARNQPLVQRLIHGDSCPDQIFRVLSLPVDVDPRRATAALNDGVLELVVPKAAISIAIRAKTDWIVRADDYRVWKECFARVLELHV
ncbi:MAG TPA: Hsp20 family protein [Candidatus Acidoferrales bacterium]|jgi:HSP20 family protein|nr:Hsp20 family protein [Candidatus Acidoferrales bacterium]